MDKMKTRQDIWASNNANSIQCVNGIDSVYGNYGIERVEGVKEINFVKFWAKYDLGGVVIQLNFILGMIGKSFFTEFARKYWFKYYI